MSNLTAYIDYFRQLAVKHKDILHDPTTEAGDGDVNKKRFSKWNVDEVVTGLRTKMSFNPSGLLIELYEVDTESQMVYDIKAFTKGAFTVLCHATVGNLAEEEAAYVKAEQITHEILQQIWQDHYGPEADSCSTPFKSFKFNKLNIVPTPKMFINEFGYRTEFDFELRNTINFTIPPADGTFIE